MTGPQREETEALLNSVSGQIVRGIAAARQLSETQVGELIDRGPLLADEAKAAGLIDRIGYRDEALAAAREPRRLRRQADAAVALSSTPPAGRMRAARRSR